MKSPIITFGIVFLIHHSVGDKQSFRITFYHPNLVQHYLDLRRSSNANTRTNSAKIPFSERGEGLVHYLCSTSLQNEKYIVLTSEDEPIDGSSTAKMEEIFEKIHIGINMKTDIIVDDEIIDVPGIEGGVNVIRCATVYGFSIYIENGYDSDEFFLFKEIEGLEGYKIELSLNLPSVNDFNASIFKASHIKRPGYGRRDICLLQGMDRLKVCSMVYQVFMVRTQPELRGIKQHFIREKSTYDDCVPIDVDDYYSNPRFHSIKAVPCAVNSEWDRPTFNVVTNHVKATGAFIFSSVGVNKMQLRKVYVLEKYPSIDSISPNTN